MSLYDCKVDMSEHRIGYGWYVGLSGRKVYAIIRGGPKPERWSDEEEWLFGVIFPYNHQLFGLAAGRLTEGTEASLDIPESKESVQIIRGSRGMTLDPNTLEIVVKKGYVELRQKPETVHYQDYQ